MKKCKYCGAAFTPRRKDQVCCSQHRQVPCPICGAVFTQICAGGKFRQTCGKIDCIRSFRTQQQSYTASNQTKLCKLCKRPFHPAHTSQQICKQYHEIACAECGKLFIVDTYKNKSDWPKYCSQSCRSAKLSRDNPFKDVVVRDRFKQTCLNKYGVEHPMKSAEHSTKPQQTYQQRTGYRSPAANPESKIFGRTKSSRLEERVAKLLKDLGIAYIPQYMLTNGAISHKYDFYLPETSWFIDCDGLYYHAYLDDPDGKHVIDYYDEDRLALLPEGASFHVIVEGQESRDLSKLVKYLRASGCESLYSNELFEWCMNTEFPYPQYSNTRMRKAWNRLKTLDVTKYVPQCRIGECILAHFHKSLFDCHVKGRPSVKDAWHTPTILSQVVANRLIYMNNVDPSKVLRGFSVTRLAPRVSLFNPVLARYLCNKYLDEYTEVFDPFSGFSGRMLGAVSTGKRYIGQDLNSSSVKESNEIIAYLGIECESQVTCKDVFQSIGEYPCLLTCPPYGDKEIYNNETVFQTCDDWITECLNRFQCSRYVFVVDHVEKYKEYIVEELKSTSHFADVSEYVVVIYR